MGDGAEPHPVEAASASDADPGCCRTGEPLTQCTGTVQFSTMSADSHVIEPDQSPLSYARHPTIGTPATCGHNLRNLFLATCGLLICTGAPSTFVTLHLVHGAIWTSLYPFSAVGILAGVAIGRRFSTMSLRKVPLAIYPAFAFAAWALLSAVWTVSPSVTPLNAMIGLGIIAFGCWFGWCVDIADQIAAALVASAIPILLSLPIIAWEPLYGRTPVPYKGASYGGDWIGVFGNRNSLAAVCSLGILSLVGHFAMRPTWKRMLWIAPMAVCEFIVLWFTEGDTALIALVGALLVGALVPLLWMLRKRGFPGALLALGGTSAAGATWVFVFGHFGALAEKAGRSPLLSSRRIIWADVRRFIAQRPIAGYGYWGFWDRADLTANTYAKVGAAYASAHNSVLEILLMLGAVGLLIYAAVAVMSVGGVLRSMWRHRSVSTWWWTMIIVYLVAENLTESFVLWHSYNWALFIAAGFVPVSALKARRRSLKPNGEP
jgi:exopolysaccharide production protein ExoQ